MRRQKSLVQVEAIARGIHVIRGQNVMVSQDLAELYGVAPKVLHQAVKRNLRRFPPDFMFQLDAEEFNALRSQFVTSKKGRGGHRYRPYAFTEQGVAMLSTVLNSPRAIDVNIEIMRVFVRLRQALASNHELARKLSELERRIGTHDEQIEAIFDAIRRLMLPPEAPQRDRLPRKGRQRSLSRELAYPPADCLPFRVTHHHRTPSASSTCSVLKSAFLPLRPLSVNRKWPGVFLCGLLLFQCQVLSVNLFLVRDRLTKERRSWNMSRIRGKNTASRFGILQQCNNERSQNIKKPYPAEPKQSEESANAAGLKDVNGNDHRPSEIDDSVEIIGKLAPAFVGIRRHRLI